ncbi:hypothetical protein [Desulfobulbus elongatus]|uniref:hypothetical protein n=1 Tax=Desulfobulbus elongatus TaxID=53332 RepID=UPI00048220C6|nr:hypothetical protein [Desulfobulbus elongatus]
MEYPVSHYFLVRSQSAELAGRHVERYLSTNQLISYAEFFVRAEEVLRGTDALFWRTLEYGTAANDRFARRMLDHLKEEGVTTLEQLPDLQQGYVTKVLHTLTHLLDGFIGIDSVFYNLIEDSHRVSGDLSTTIHAHPADFWLVPVRTGKLEASVLHPVD